MKSVLLKSLGVPILVIFMNSGFILFDIEVFTNFSTLVPIALLNIIISVDIIIRPISPKKDEYNRSILLLSFLLFPMILVLPYYEYKVFIHDILVSSLYLWALLAGSTILLLGGIILLISRLQLGKYGGPRIVIETNHKLVTNGIYRFIRHPMYLGFLILFFGYSLSMGSIFMTVVISLAFFLIFKNRIDIEERLLLSEFGEEYADYMERTNRLFPFLY